MDTTSLNISGSSSSPGGSHRIYGTYSDDSENTSGQKSPTGFAGTTYNSPEKFSPGYPKSPAIYGRDTQSFGMSDSSGSRFPAQVDNASYLNTRPVQQSPVTPGSSGTPRRRRTLSSIGSPFTSRAFDRTDDLDTTPHDNMWIATEQNIHNVMQEELRQLREMTPETQMEYLKIWFEDYFTDAMLFNYCTSTIKTILSDHCTDVSIHRDYPHGPLIQLLSRTLTTYRQRCEKYELEIADITAQMSQKINLEVEKMQDHKQCVKELVDGMSARLSSANERAINARQQTAGLQVQLAEALARIEKLEGRHDGTFVKDVLSNRTFSPKRPIADRTQTISSGGQSYIEEMEQSIASGDSRCSNLQLELSRVSAENEGLRTFNREKSERIAVLEGELEASREESLYKTRLLTSVSDEIIDSFEAHISRHLLETSLHNLTPEDDVFITWPEELQRIMDEKGGDINQMIRLLTDQQYHLNDVKMRVADKQMKIDILEQHRVAANNEFIRKKVDLEALEMQVNIVYGDLLDTQNALNIMRKELFEKVGRVEDLKFELYKTEKEISALNGFRLHLSGQKEVGKNIPAPSQSVKEVLASVSTDSNRSSFLSSVFSSAFRSFDSLGPKISTPLRSFDSNLVSLTGEKDQANIVVKSPDATDPLVLNVSLLPSPSGEHVQCNFAADKFTTQTPIRCGWFGHHPSFRRSILGDEYSELGKKKFQVKRCVPIRLFSGSSDFTDSFSSNRSYELSSPLTAANRTYETQKARNITQSFTKEDQNRTSTKFVKFQNQTFSPLTPSRGIQGSTYTSDSPKQGEKSSSEMSSKLNQTF